MQEQVFRGEVILRSGRWAVAWALALLGACSGGGGTDAPASPPTPVVARVTVTPASLDLSIGESASLQAQGSTAAGVPITGRPIQWSSSAPAVATVTAGGVVTAVSAGSAAITATIDGVTAAAGVTVRASLVVLPDTVTVTSIGAQVNTTVTVNGQPATAAFALLSDRRWLHDRAVLDSTLLGAGRVVAFGAGRAVVRVTAAGLSDTVVVNVAPTQPHVFGVLLPGGRTHVGSNDTLLLRGYRMQQVTAATIQPATAGATLVGQDSATARVVVPTLQTASCTGRGTV